MQIDVAQSLPWSLRGYAPFPFTCGSAAVAVTNLGVASNSFTCESPLRKTDWDPIGVGSNYSHLDGRRAKAAATTSRSHQHFQLREAAAKNKLRPLRRRIIPFHVLIKSLPFTDFKKIDYLFSLIQKGSYLFFDYLFTYFFKTIKPATY